MRSALAASTACRPGIAASVTRIMPVLYSLLITSTASIATTAWPNWTPVRLSLVVSTGQVMFCGQWVAPTAAALTAMVSAAAPRSSQAGPDTVCSLVHSACSAYRRLLLLAAAVASVAAGCVRTAALMRLAAGAERMQDRARRPPRGTARRTRHTEAAGSSPARAKGRW